MNPLYSTKKQTALVFLVALGLACFGLSPSMQAVAPAPDGGYPGGNTAEGQAALLSRTTGGFNTAVGFLSLRNDTTGSFNTAIGAGTLFLNTADNNTATGTGALLSNTTGIGNTANGAFALFHNTIGGANTVNGYQALYLNTTGYQNTANGVSALSNNTTGNNNTATGLVTLGSNTTGNANTANGSLALYNNGAGSFNTANGYQALYSTIGNNNIALGAVAGINVTTASNVICIGAPGANLGNSCYVGQIFGQPVDPATAVPVFVDTTGKLGTAFSSRRFKHDIKPMAKGSEVILALEPVTFHYKTDKTNTPQFGLIAEEVAKVNPDLVVRDKNGEVYTVRYDAVNAMLLNEFLKEHQKVEDLEKDFQATVARQEKQIEALTAGLQKVSAQLELSKAAPQTVLNNQ